MRLTFTESGLNMVFEVTEEGKLLLLHCAEREFKDTLKGPEKNEYLAFSLHINGQNPTALQGGKHIGISGETFRYVNHSLQKDAEKTHLTFELTNDQTTVYLHYVLFKGLTVLRAWTEIENRSDEVIGLSYLSSFALFGIGGGAPEDLRIYLPHNAWRREVDWKIRSLSELGFEKNSSHSTQRVHLSNTGSWSAKEYLPMGALDNRKTQSAMLWQIENNGSWQWEISDNNGPMYLLLSGPDEAENHWYRELKRGERFESVKVAVAFGGTFDESLAQMTAYRRRIVHPTPTDSALPVIFNDYMNCLWAEPTTEKELPLIERAARLGAEYYCMDAGWYADGVWWDTVGEWEACAWRFPGGIRKVFDRVRECGMIPGIWVEIEVMGIRCPILPRFGDDCFIQRHGKRVIDRGRYQLDFRNPKVRAFATSVMDRLISDYGVGYIKIDYNVDIGAGTDYDSDSPGDGLLSYNRAYLAWIASIREKYPHLVLENCSSGGMRMDYAMLAHHAIQSVTDQEDCVCMAPIAAAAATAVLPEQAAIWVYPKASDSDALVAMNLVNAMPLRIHLSGEVMNWSEEQIARVKEGISVYKQIRDGIARSYPFYPLGLPGYGDDWLCSAYRHGQTADVCVWRINGCEDEVNIPFREEIFDARILFPSASASEIRTDKDVLHVRIPDSKNAVFVRVFFARPN